MIRTNKCEGERTFMYFCRVRRDFFIISKSKYLHILYREYTENIFPFALLKKQVQKKSIL